MTDRQAPSFTLKVLGGFQLVRSGVAVDVPTRKLACLLAYLACTAPVPQPREKLANLFWGQQGEDRARHNLRQALMRLRTLLGHDAIISSGEALLLNPGAFEADVARFEALLAQGDAASVAMAADLYGGALLEDVPVGDSTWNEWLLRERFRLSERAVDAMVAQGESSLAAGGADRAMQCGRRAIAIDNFREDGHRLLLRALARAGRNSEALRHYHELVALLRAELGAEPDTETSELADALARRRPAGAADSVTLARLDPRPAASPDAVAGGRAIWRDGAERRQVTVFVCEPAAPGPIDPEDLQDFIQDFRQAAASTVAEFGGVVVTGAGSSLQALFGHPEPRERDAVQAVRAGRALVQAVQSLAVASGSPLRASVGIAAGLVVVEDDADPEKGGGPVAIGEASTLAPQLLATAAPGQIVVSRETRPLLARWFELRRSDPVGRTGAPRSVDAWLVCGETDEGGRLEGDPRRPLIGRQEELDLLLRRWDQVRQGQGRVVLLSGEPGIGKSSLAEELGAVLGGDRPAYLRYDCSPHHVMRPLHPYITNLERSARLSSAAGSAEKLDRIASLVAPTSTDAPGDVALLAEFLGLQDPRYPPRDESPQRKRELVMKAYLDMLEGLAADRPVVMLFEDIHWIDPTSLDLLDRTIERIANLPVLLVVTLRPEHQPAWVGQSHVTLLHLNRLGGRDSAAIVGEMSRDRPLPQPIAEQIIDRAEGVPLFVVELSKHVIESAAQDEAADGGAVADGRPRRSMPANLQAALSVRFEGLGGAKALALIGSAIGRQFSHALICAVADGEVSDLDEQLDRFRASGLLARRGTPPDATYAFTHALGRDAAYGLIVKSRKRRLHSRIADILRDRFAGQPEGLPEMVAHHLSQAGRIGEAADFWIAAGRAAQARWANRECAAFFDLALRAIGEQPTTPASLRKAIDLRFEMKNALTPVGEFDRIIECLQDARVLIDSLGDAQRLCQFQVHMSQALGFCGRSNEAIACGQEAARLARLLGDTRLRVEATVFLATAYFAVTDYDQSERLFQDVLDLIETLPRGERFALAGFPEITAHIFLAGVNAVRGDFERGLLYGETALEQAEALAQPYSLGVSIWCLADLHLKRGRVANAIELLERGLALSRTWDLPFMVAAHTASLGYAYALTQRADEGLPLLERAVLAFEEMRHQLGLSLFSVPLAEAYVLSGQLDQAAAFAADALKMARETGQRGGEAGFQRILADVSAGAGHFEQAEAGYRAAMELAEILGLRPLAARCRHGLARVSASMGDDEKARHELAAATAMYREMGMGFWLEPLGPPLSS